MYQVEYSKQAIRTLRRIPANTSRLIREKITLLAENSLAMPGVKKLTNAEGYRLRVGDWRVLYLLDGTKLLVMVTEIGPRGGIYK
jgi:mRNA interferase RelE/StbE